MSLSDFFLALRGFFNFPDEILALVKVLRKTTPEKRQEIMKRIQAEKITFDQSGRPKWE